MKLVSHAGIAFFLAAVLLVLFPAAAALQAQPSWWSDPVEPQMIGVQGTLLNPETIVVNLVIRGNPVTLTRWDALVFLSVRDYLEYDNVTRRYYTTEKYRIWKQQRPIGITGPQNPQGQVGSSQVGGGTGGGAPVSVQANIVGNWKSTADETRIEIYPTGPYTFEAKYKTVTPYGAQCGHRVGQIEIRTIRWDGHAYAGQILIKSPGNQAGYWVDWTGTVNGDALATSLGSLVRIN
jgi:hypothetical protein